VMTSDSPDDKIPMSDGSMENFLPSKKLKLAVDLAQVLKTNTVGKKDQSKVASQLEWTYRENTVLKSNLAIFDILVNNNWERPIYFGTSISSDSYVGLEKYLYLEGYAYRLLPIKSALADDGYTMEEQTNSDVMYNNIMHKLDFRGFKSAAYQDPESRRIAGTSVKYINNLTVNLLGAGEKEKARKLMVKSITDIPTKNYSIEDTLTKVLTVQNLYAVKETSAANRLATETGSFIEKELAYLASLDTRRKNSYGREVELGVYVIASLEKMAREQKQIVLSNHFKNLLQNLQVKFS